MAKYEVIATGVYLKDGQAKIGDVINLDGDVSHLSAKLKPLEGKSFEVATPEEDDSGGKKQSRNKK